jgi:hypothetical protein
MGMSKDDILTAIAEMSVMEVVELIERNGREVRRDRRCCRGRSTGRSRRR